MPMPPATSRNCGALNESSKWLFGSPICISLPVSRFHMKREPPRPGSARFTAMR
jgi:hypothetical protein